MEKDLVKAMPFLPQMFQDAMPTHVPAMQYRTGIVKDIVHNMKLGRMSKDMARRKEIAENQNAIIKANLDTMHAVMTFSARMQDTFEEYQFRRDVRKAEIRRCDLENQKTELKNQFLYQKIKEQEGKNILLQMEIKQQEIDLRMKEREVDGSAGD